MLGFGWEVEGKKKYKTQHTPQGMHHQLQLPEVRQLEYFEMANYLLQTVGQPTLPKYLLFPCGYRFPVGIGYLRDGLRRNPGLIPDLQSDTANNAFHSFLPK